MYVYLRSTQWYVPEAHAMLWVWLTTTKEIYTYTARKVLRCADGTLGDATAEGLMQTKTVFGSETNGLRALRFLVDGMSSSSSTGRSSTIVCSDCFPECEAVGVIPSAGGPCGLRMACSAKTLFKYRCQQKAHYLLRASGTAVSKLDPE